MNGNWEMIGQETNAIVQVEDREYWQKMGSSLSLKMF